MHKERGTSRGSKLVHIGDLCMGLISRLQRANRAWWSQGNCSGINLHVQSLSCNSWLTIRTIVISVKAATSIPPLPTMYSRMSAPVPQALAVSSKPIGSTSSASKVKAPTISEIHVMPQWAITRFSSLAPFDADEWDQPFISPGSIQEVVPHYWDKCAYVAKLAQL